MAPKTLILKMPRSLARGVNSTPTRLARPRPIESISGGSAMRLRIFSSVVVLLAAALGCQAKTPEPRVVDLTAKDGVHLKATYFAAAKPGPGVILLHQCNQQRKNWDDLAVRLAAAGINVLTLDYRGYGDSQGPRALELSNEDRTKMIT